MHVNENVNNVKVELERMQNEGIRLFGERFRALMYPC